MAPQKQLVLVVGITASVLTLIAIRPSFERAIPSSDYLPHRFCYMALRWLIWTHVLADALIAISYTVISFTLGYLIYRCRQDIPFEWMFLAFGLFIVACGVTHAMEVVTTWVPVYVLSGVLKVFTALVSGLTAVFLPFTVPKILNPVRQAKTSEINRKKFIGLLETTPDAIVVMNTHAEMVLVNAQTEKIFGYSREELLGRRIETLLADQPKQGGPGPLNFLSDLCGRSVTSGVELSGLRKDGYEFPVEVSLSPLETEEGTLLSSAIRDIADRKGTEENLRRAQRVEGSDAWLGELRTISTMC